MRTSEQKSVKSWCTNPYHRRGGHTLYRDESSSLEGFSWIYRLRSSECERCELQVLATLARNTYANYRTESQSDLNATDGTF